MAIDGKHSHYFKDVRTLCSVDVYRVCELFGVDDTSGALQHAIKKLLVAGGRGAKDYAKDISEARDTLTRKLDMLTGDEGPKPRKELSNDIVNLMDEIGAMDMDPVTRLHVLACLRSLHKNHVT